MVNIKNIVIGIAIFILTLSVGIYGIGTLYGDEPQWNDYCPQINTITECIDAGGKWINNTYVNPDGSFSIPADGSKPIPVKEDGYCDNYEKCNKELEDAQRKYSKKVFLTVLPLGIAIIAAGAIIFGLEAVGSGLMAGGVGIIIFGISRFWRFTEDWLKFVLSLVGLIVVIWLAYYANKKWWKKK
jgi:hypothetical protein